MMDTGLLDIELTAPQTLNGRKLRHQSLWFLVRLHHAHAEAPSAPLVRQDDLRGHVSEAANVRMVISRAVRDLEAAGVRVGWGEPAGRDPRFLNADRRSQGPFWIRVEDARRIRCLVHGEPAGEGDIRVFLGLGEGRAQSLPGAGTGAFPFEPLNFWRFFFGAGQAMREGRLVDPTIRAALGPGALAGLRAAHGEAHGDTQRAFATLNEALVWRRLGDYDQARARLRRLKAHRRQSHVIGNDYLDAMERVIAAWCAYDQRDLASAESWLASMAEGEERAAVLRHHPQIRFEWHNLSGLLHRGRALTALAARRPEAMAEAHRAFDHFDRAFAAALESMTAEPVQRVAANLGFTLWLLRGCGIGDVAEDEARAQAVRWIALSEWLSRTAGTELHTAWNAIVLMRIARDAANLGREPPMAAFRRFRPRAPGELFAAAEPFAEAFAPAVWPARWADAAALRVALHDRGERRYSKVQLGGLLFEGAWHALGDGEEDAALAALARLNRLLPDLAEPDRAFFLRDCLPLLPDGIGAPVP
jgi:hypothetical protein